MNMELAKALNSVSDFILLCPCCENNVAIGTEFEPFCSQECKTKFTNMFKDIASKIIDKTKGVCEPDPKEG